MSFRPRPAKFLPAPCRITTAVLLSVAVRLEKDWFRNRFRWLMVRRSASPWRVFIPRAGGVSKVRMKTGVKIITTQFTNVPTVRKCWWPTVSTLPIRSNTKPRADERFTAAAALCPTFLYRLTLPETRNILIPFTAKD